MPRSRSARRSRRSFSLGEFGGGGDLPGPLKLVPVIPFLMFLAGGVLLFLHAYNHSGVTLVAFDYTTQVLDISFEENLEMQQSTTTNATLWSCPSTPHLVQWPSFQACHYVYLGSGAESRYRFYLNEGSQINATFDPVFSNLILFPNLREYNNWKDQESFEPLYHCRETDCEVPLSFTLHESMPHFNMVLHNARQGVVQESTLCMIFELFVHDLEQCTFFCNSLDQNCAISRDEYDQATWILQGGNEPSIGTDWFVSFSRSDDDSLRDWGFRLLNWAIIIFLCMPLVAFFFLIKTCCQRSNSI
ncbi:hypothetical protein P9112_014334 [Eukaryota sp. TZLM1-RC]